MDAPAEAIVLPPTALNLMDASTHQIDPDEQVPPITNPLLEQGGLIVTTQAAMTEMIATAVAAAVDAQAAPKATAAKVRAAALDAISPPDNAA
jgi:hypothetical protein